MSMKLKVKSKSLAAEARIIRCEEIKLKRQIRWLREHQRIEEAKELDNTRMSLYNHRKQDVRGEARASELARAFLAGKAYKDVEAKTHSGEYEMNYLIGRVHKLVKKYGKAGTTPEEMREWFGR